MKFGKAFAELSSPEYVKFNLDYKKLQKVIKISIEKTDSADSPAGSGKVGGSAK